MIALMARSTTTLTKKTLKRDRVLWALMAVNALSTAIFEKESMVLVIAAGLLVLVVRGGPAKPTPAAPAFALPALVTGLHGPVGAGTLGKVLTYFTTAGLFVFGSGLAIVPFLHGGVVTENAWLTERQFLDAVAVAMLTPGPVVITVGFIGYLVAGIAGAVLAAVGVFVPCFFVVVLAAPHYRRFVANVRVKAFVQGVTAGAVGAVAGSVVVLARRALIDLPTVLVFGGTLLALWRVKKLPEPVVIALSALVGIVIAKVREAG